MKAAIKTAMKAAIKGFRCLELLSAAIQEHLVPHLSGFSIKAATKLCAR
jgi:hypothetical protein